MTPPRNASASVRQRLLNRSRSERRPFNELLQYFAMERTFERRGTVLPSEIEVFTQPFIDAKQTQWAAFRNRLQQDHVPASFGEITASVSRFLWPIVAALSSEKSSPTDWIAPGPWT